MSGAGLNWRVSHTYAGGSYFWQVYRLKSVCAVDHSGNREYRGGLFNSEADAQRYADELNREECFK